MSEKELQARIEHCWKVLELHAVSKIHDNTQSELLDAIGFLRGQYDPVRLDAADISSIKDIGIAGFHTLKNVPLDSKKAQVFLVLAALREFMLRHRKLPTFKVESNES